MSTDRRPAVVETISDRRRNPFGLSPRCPGGSAVPGYGDPSADFHVVGDHPGRHGGRATGVPFTDHPAGRRVQGLLHDLGLLESPYADDPAVVDLYLSYLHMCVSEGETDPPPAAYERLERFFDAELRAVNAHVLVPVGRRATEVILAGYTTQAGKVPPDMDDRHAMEIRGRGFLVVPVKDPSNWGDGDWESIRSVLARIRASDYRQTKGVATLIG